jgi:NAD(P)-dependent dehydrogenase (short-subunit alcohol dehydrogenase family)
MSLSAAKLNDMTGLHVLVTGAGSGIGLMMAKTYAAHNATVYLVGRRKDKLEEAKGIIGASAIVLQGDISSKAGLNALLEAYKKVSQTNHLDILVGNAGIFRGEAASWKADLDADEMSAQFLSSEYEGWTETASLNVASQYFLVGTFLPLLSAAEDGNVLITSSIAGLHWSPTSSNPSYSASKAAINHLVKVMANRLVGLYVRVNAIAPGIFPSELVTEETIKRMGAAIAKIPAKRMGEERDIGQAAVFCAMCRYLDGQVIAVDGGRSLNANGH